MTNDTTNAVGALIAKWREAAPEERDYYADALRACANELEAALRSLAGAQGEAVYRVARTLSDRQADECNVDREDNWKIHGDSYREDAEAVIAALTGAEHG